MTSVIPLTEEMTNVILATKLTLMIVRIGCINLSYNPNRCHSSTTV